jgi:hypothetical protein
VNEHRVGTWLFTTVTAMLAGFAAIILSGSPLVIGVAVLVATAAATVVGRSSLPSPARMSDVRAAGAAGLFAVVLAAGVLGGEPATGLLVGMGLYLTVWLLDGDG